MQLKLIKKSEEVPGITTFVFEPSEALEWQAGQYLHYVLPHEPADERGAERWFTVASAPYEKTPQITTRLAGDEGSSFKRALAALTVGDSIEADGPEGDFVLADSNAAYAFLAGGIGITPFHSMLKQADHDKVKLNVTLLYANRDDKHPFRAELDAFAGNNPNLKIVYLVNPERVDETTIAKHVTDLSMPVFYLSGPEPMVKALATELGTLGVDESRIKLDDFPGYPFE